LRVITVSNFSGLHQFTSKLARARRCPAAKHSTAHYQCLASGLFPWFPGGPDIGRPHHLDDLPRFLDQQADLGPESDNRFESRSPGQGSGPVWSLMELRQLTTGKLPGCRGRLSRAWIGYPLAGGGSRFFLVWLADSPVKPYL